MELKSKIWMNGNLEWYTYIGENEVFLGCREVPYPLGEGDKWTNALGDVFQVIEGEIRHLERISPPDEPW